MQDGNIILEGARSKADQELAVRRGRSQVRWPDSDHSVISEAEADDSDAVEAVEEEGAVDPEPEVPAAEAPRAKKPPRKKKISFV